MSWEWITDWKYLSIIIIVAWALFIIAIERIKPYDKGEKFFRRGFTLDFVWYALIQSYILGLLINGGLEWVDKQTGYAAHGVLSDWPVWLQVVFFVFLHDLYIYWFHRFQHSNKYLWRIHEAHHSVKHVDWIAGSRSHPLEIIINQSIEVGAMLLLGIHPDIIFIKMTISVCWGVWIHCNIDVRSGWLQFFINGPEMHRWHHALNYPDTKLKGMNFGTKFAFWDWIHGSAYLPKEKPGVYGVLQELPGGYFGQCAAAFRRFGPYKNDPEQAEKVQPIPPWPGREHIEPRHTEESVRLNEEAYTKALLDRRSTGGDVDDQPTAA